MKNSILLTLSICVVACVPSAPSTQPYSDLVVTMQRGLCYGTCPVYRLTIHGDGNVDYEGILYVAIQGPRSTKISSDEIQELIGAIENAAFFSLKDEYVAYGKDLPSVTLSITIDGRSKSIWHSPALDCSGKLDNAPRELCELESKIDEIVNSDQWVDQE